MPDSKKLNKNDSHNTNQKEKSFQLLLRVRFAECDSQKIVFNARYGDYVDVAATEYFRALFGGYEKLIDQGIDYQVVRLSTEWKSPAKFDDVISITVETVKTGNTSFVMQFDFTDPETGREIASAEQICVMVTAGDHQKLPIPDNIRALLERGAPGIVANYSGIN